MVVATNQSSNKNDFATVPNLVEAIRSLSVDDQLGLLWTLYENMGGLVTPAAPGATERIKLAGGLIYEVANLSHKEQFQVMQDLVAGVNTPITRAYGCLSSNNKLAFWYQLAEWMRSGEVIPVPTNYRLSAPVSAVFNRIVAVEFGQQIAILRLVVAKMGIDPLSA